jgi:hypothetical protein
MENARHLSGLPLDWEVAQGTIAERVAKVGRSAIDYRELAQVKNGSGDETAWRKVQSLGAESMKLVMGSADPLKDVTPPDALPSNTEREITDDNSVDAVNSEGPTESKVLNDPSADVSAILDADYDTSGWSVHEIESGCNTLLNECESTPVLRRRVLATRMLLRLIDRHPEARKFVEVAFETIVQRGIPTMSYGISERTFSVAHLLAAVTPRLATKLSTLNATPRIVKMVMREANTAASVLQNKVRLRQRRRREKEAGDEGAEQPPVEIRARQRLMENMKTDDLNLRFRQIRFEPLAGKVPPDVLYSYLSALLELTSSQHGEYATESREQMVSEGGLVMLTLCLKAPGNSDLCAVARGIVRNMSETTELLGALLVAQTAPALLRGLEDSDPTVKCSTLAVLDSYAAAAVAVAPLPEESTLGPSVFEGGTPDANATALLRLAGHSTDLIPRVGILEKQDTNGALRDVIKRFLASPAVLGALLGQLRGEHAEVFLGAVLVAHKLACSVFYHAVLQEMVAVGGQLLERALDAFQSNLEAVAVAVAAFLAQLATRQEGRDALVASETATMLAPLLLESRDPEGREYLLALTVATSLAEYATLPPVLPSAEALDLRPERLKDRLYHNLVASLTRPEPAAALFVARCESFHCMPALLRFLVRPEAPTHLFDLPKQHRLMGALILHRMARHNPSLLFHNDAVVLYGAFLVQHNYGEMCDGTVMRSDEQPLFFLSTQAACLLLAELCGSSFPSDARSRVALKIKRINALPEVVGLLRYPEHKYDPLYKLKMECVVAAALLLAAVAARPEPDALPEAELELRGSEVELNAACAGQLEALVSATAKSLLRIVECCDHRSAVATASLALARFAATNESARLLLQEGAMLKLAKLVPNRPTVKHNMSSSEKDSLMRGDAASMTRLPPAFFRLVAQLCRLPDGQREVQASGLLKRCVERMAMGDGSPHDVAVRTECALLVSRMANKFSNEFGSSTEFLLATKFKLVPTLCAMMHSTETRRTRYAAAAALRALCDDVGRGAPAVAAAHGPGGEKASVHLVAVLLESPKVAHPLLRQVLGAVLCMAKCPGGVLDAELLAVGAKEALLRIAADPSLEDAYRGQGVDRVGLGDAARNALNELTDASGKPVFVDDGSAALPKRGEVSEAPALGSSSDESRRSEAVDGAFHQEPGCEHGVGRHDEKETTAKGGMEGTYSSMGVTSHGSLIGSAADNTDEVQVTPLALLSARDKAFRRELRRRKRYHDLDRPLPEEEALPEPEERPRGEEEHKLTHVPLVSLKDPKSICTVASTRQNPHLRGTRPARPKPFVPLAPAESLTARPAAVPLALQSKQQAVSSLLPALPNTLMLDPTFGESLANISGDTTKESQTSVLKQISAHVFGSEQFRHSSEILGHRVGVTSHRMVPGRVNESSAHRETTSFKNVEGSIAAMLEDRLKNGDGMKETPAP